ncbi:hypothetical protein EDC53_102337 [Phytobacter diazotrophicus]|nr:hypothetical protein EDC53_102337 [Phytobacter diazotrophicus]
MNTLGLKVSSDKERESESDKRSLSNNRKPNRHKNSGLEFIQNLKNTGGSMSQQPNYDEPLPSDRPLHDDPERLPPDEKPLDPDVPDTNVPETPLKPF